ncbi:hypothetical protein EBZ80_09320 [bacterium]|nr:hypothetical protein [bacterium]
MDFNWDSAVPTGRQRGTPLKTPEDALRILRLQILEMCDGKMPEGKAKRTAIVVSAIGALTLKTATLLRQQHPNAPVEQLAASGQHAMALLTTAATVVILDLFDFDFDKFVAEQVGDAPQWKQSPFSDN